MDNKDLFVLALYDLHNKYRNHVKIMPEKKVNIHVLLIWLLIGLFRCNQNCININYANDNQHLTSSTWCLY